MNNISLCKGEKAHGQITTTLKHFHVLDMKGLSASSANNNNFNQGSSNFNNFNNNNYNNNQGFSYPGPASSPNYNNYYQTQRPAPAAYRPPQSSPSYRPPFGQNTGVNTNSIEECGKIQAGGVSLVVHGNSYRRGDWPWLTALFYQNSFICGGTLGEF